MRLVAFTALVLACVACRPGAGPAPRVPTTAVPGGVLTPIPVSDADFARETHRLLIEGVHGAKDRDALAGVVERQLARAQTRFEAGSDEAGLDALVGAMMLLDPESYRPEVFARSVTALQSGAAVVARGGNEGRSLALYSTLQTLLPPGPARDDAAQHLRGLDEWSTAMAKAGPLQAAGLRQRTACDRALFEITPERLTEARKATVSWIRSALAYDGGELGPDSSYVEREEAIQAYRALKTGGVALVGLYLRSGDAEGALHAIDDKTVDKVMLDALAERLEGAAKGDPRAWAELNAFYEEAAQGEAVEVGIDTNLARAAAWGTAVELARLAGDEPTGVMPLAKALSAHGMVEVAPLVLADAFGEKVDAYPLSWALALVLGGMLSETEVGQHAAARRTYEAAAPLLKLAERRDLRADVRPSAARLHYVMGALEAQAGEIEGAAARLTQAIALEPDQLEALRLLAAVERQRGKAARATELLRKAAGLARAKQDDAEVAELSLSEFELHREGTGGGEAALRTALERALAARVRGHSSKELARAERLVARALEHYGDVEGARRATARALEAARSDAEELAATLLDAARRALTLGDLRLARLATREAIDADVADEDLVYVALWQQLLERRLGEVSDGTAAEALAKLTERGGWVATLGAWGRGELTDDALSAAARSRAERTEAAFYVAMNAHTARDATTGLAPVAQSESIELVEVTIARDLLATAGKRPPALPAVDLP